MRFEIRNRAQIANKYIRFAKWKIRKLCSVFGEVIYTELYVSKVSSQQELYKVVLKLGVSGPDIIISEEHSNLKKLWSNISAKLKRQLRKQNEKRLSK